MLQERALRQVLSNGTSRCGSAEGPSAVTHEGRHGLPVDLDCESGAHRDIDETHASESLRDLVSREAAVIIFGSLPIPLDEKATRPQACGQLIDSAGVVVEERTDRRAHHQIELCGFRWEFHARALIRRLQCCAPFFVSHLIFPGQSVAVPLDHMMCPDRQIRSGNAHISSQAYRHGCAPNLG